METFDAYHLWLGIPPSEQPPDHYRLLGVSFLEDNPDVIANAADQRMAHVRTFQSGKHSERSQTLLNELSAARICLLNPAKKTAYDAELSRKDQGLLREEDWTACESSAIPAPSCRKAGGVSRVWFHVAGTAFAVLPLVIGFWFFFNRGSVAPPPASVEKPKAVARKSPVKSVPAPPKSPVITEEPRTVSSESPAKPIPLPSEPPAKMPEQAPVISKPALPPQAASKQEDSRRANDLRRADYYALRVAQLVLTYGGTVSIQGDPTEISSVAALPQGSFKLCSLKMRPNFPIRTEDLHLVSRISTLTYFSLAPSDGRFRFRITDEVMQHLSANPGLKEVLIENADITDEGVRQLCQFANLRGLLLNDAKITDEALHFVANQRDLVWICLCRNNISDDGLKYLAQLPQLEHVNLLDMPKLTDRTLEILQSYPALKLVWLASSQFSAEALQKFKTACPNCEIKP